MIQNHIVKKANSKLASVYSICSVQYNYIFINIIYCFWRVQKVSVCLCDKLGWTFRQKNVGLVADFTTTPASKLRQLDKRDKVFIWDLLIYLFI